MKNPLKIVHVVGSGFAGDWAYFPLVMLKDRGHDVTLVCNEEGPLPRRCREAGVPVQIVPFPRRLRNLRQGCRYLKHMRTLLKSIRADVVHNHLSPANFWGRAAAWISRVPVRVTGWPGPLPLEIPLFLRLELATVWMDTGIIAACKATARIFEEHGVPRNRIHLIYYGFPFQNFDPAMEGAPIRREFGITDDALVVSLIAYMYSPMQEKKGSGLSFFQGYGLKGHEIFIQAAARVRERLPGVRFLIVGDSLVPGDAENYKKKLRQMVTDLRLEQTVIFTGIRKDIGPLLAAVDVAAVPSLSENVGGAIEPFFMEKPVVASRVGGLPDVVIEGRTGFLVPPRDPGALADALIQALELSPARRREMGQRGGEIVRGLFDLNVTVSQTESLYHQLLRGVKPARATAAETTVA